MGKRGPYFRMWLYSYSASTEQKKKGHLFSLHGAETSVCISPTCRIAEVLFMVRAGGCFVREVGVQ